jgi:hypothetical protein
VQKIQDSPSERGRAPAPSEGKWLLKQIGLAVLVIGVLVILLFGATIMAWSCC